MLAATATTAASAAAECGPSRARCGHTVRPASPVSNPPAAASAPRCCTAVALHPSADPRIREKTWAIAALQVANPRHRRTCRYSLPFPPTGQAAPPLAAIAPILPVDATRAARGCLSSQLPGSTWYGGRRSTQPRRCAVLACLNGCPPPPQSRPQAGTPWALALGAGRRQQVAPYGLGAAAPPLTLEPWSPGPHVPLLLPCAPGATPCQAGPCTTLLWPWGSTCLTLA